jgi:hypothetical protein
VFMGVLESLSIASTTINSTNTTSAGGAYRIAPHEFPGRYLNNTCAPTQHWSLTSCIHAGATNWPLQLGWRALEILLALRWLQYECGLIWRKAAGDKLSPSRHELGVWHHERNSVSWIRCQSGAATTAIGLTATTITAHYWHCQRQVAATRGTSLNLDRKQC